MSIIKTTLQQRTRARNWKRFRIKGNCTTLRILCSQQGQNGLAELVSAIEQQLLDQLAAEQKEDKRRTKEARINK